MITIQRAAERGTFRNHWLEAHFSFEFGAYRNPRRRAYSDLLVLNEDIVLPRQGFAMHPHHDVEVFSYPLCGTVEHRDTLGNYALLGYGDVHLMSAGSGIAHSEMNGSAVLPERHLQWWIQPRRQGTPPSYARRHFTREMKLDRLCPIAGPDGGEVLPVDQDVWIYAALVRQQPLVRQVARHRRCYLHVVSGELQLGQLTLFPGDGVQLEDEPMRLESGAEAEILLFDLR